MRKILFLLSICMLSFGLHAQVSLTEVIRQAEENSQSLQAMINSNQAENMAARKEIWPEKPSIEVGYAPNRNETSEIKKTLSVSQGFNFPTVWFQKAKYRKYLQEKAKYSEESFRQEIRLQARISYADLVFFHKRMTKENVRLENAKEMLAYFQLRFDKGDANILDLNKARIDYQEHMADYRLLQAERTNVLEQLRWLTQNPELEVNAEEYELLELKEIEPMFESYTANDASLKALNANYQMEAQEARLLKNEFLPDIEVGYEIEKTPNEDFRGFSLGLSIPLWGNQSRHRQAKALQRSAEYEYLDQKTLMFSNFKMMYNRTKSLEQNYVSLKQSIESYNAEELLTKALKTGQINSIDYFTELDSYYETICKYLEAEKEYHQSLATLLKYSF